LYRGTCVSAFEYDGRKTRAESITSDTKRPETRSLVSGLLKGLLGGAPPW
jgi:hypothetical protein